VQEITCINIVMNYAEVWDENEDEREIIIDRLMGMDCQFI